MTQKQESAVISYLVKHTKGGNEFHIGASDWNRVFKFSMPSKEEIRKLLHTHGDSVEINEGGFVFLKTGVSAERLAFRRKT